MAKAKRKTGILGFILLGVVVLGLAMAVVGILIDYVNVTTSAVIVGSKTEGLTLAELSDKFKDVAQDKLPEMYSAMRAFAILAVILTAVTAVLTILTRFFRIKLFASLSQSLDC